jgi:hypothetical protein
MSTSDVEQVLLVAEQRAIALAAGDPDALRALMHPSLQWTTYKGDLLSREQYVAGNTGGVLTWKSQRLEGTRVVVIGDTAVLTALVTDESSEGRTGPVVHTAFDADLGASGERLAMPCRQCRAGGRVTCRGESSRLYVP